MCGQVRTARGSGSLAPRRSTTALELSLIGGGVQAVRLEWIGPQIEQLFSPVCHSLINEGSWAALGYAPNHTLQTITHAATLRGGGRAETGDDTAYRAPRSDLIVAPPT